MQFQKSFLNLLNSETKLKIVKFLLNHEASMSEREIASILNISHMSVNRTMRELEQMNFVHYTTVGKAHLWRVNQRSYAHKTLSQFFDHIKDMPDPLVELKKVILKHLPKSFIQKVVLFGSIAKNKEEPDSDIDLFILVKNAHDQESIEDSIEKLSNACLDMFGNRLSPYILTNAQFEKRQSLNVISAIKSGIQIYPNGKVKI